MHIIIIGVWLFCALLAASIANQKGRSAGGWLLLGLILGPIATAVIAVSGRIIPLVDEVGKPALKVCPDCQAVIPAMAKVCMHCGYRFTELPQPPIPPNMSRWKRRDREAWEAKYIASWGVTPDQVRAAAAAAPQPILPRPPVDTSKWSKRDREAWAAKNSSGRQEPRL